jgi:hypothetical protein
MQTIQSRVQAFIFLGLAVPVAFGFFTLSAFESFNSSNKEAQVASKLNWIIESTGSWTNSTAKQMQNERSKLPDGEIQVRLSSWIQANNEGNSSLISQRKAELKQSLDKVVFKASQDQEAWTQQVQIAFGVMFVFIAGLSLFAWTTLRKDFVPRITDVTEKLQNFRILTYNSEIKELKNNDELTNLYRAFYSLVDNLFEDLHYDLGLKHSDQSPDRRTDQTVKESVQTYLIERRTIRDRRAQKSIHIDNERRALDRRKTS